MYKYTYICACVCINIHNALFWTVCKSKCIVCDDYDMHVTNIRTDAALRHHPVRPGNHGGVKSINICSDSEQKRQNCNKFVYDTFLKTNKNK